MGLQFVDLTDDQKNTIKEFIAYMVEKKSVIQTDKIRLLLVDENDTSRRINKSKLTLEGFYVIEAIKFLKEDTPDLIILDLAMRKMDGFKVLSILKESPRWHDIPV